MSEQSIERCIECDEPTGRAGRSEDSLFCDTCDAGPFCETCHEVHGYICHINTLTRELAEVKAACEIKDEALRLLCSAWKQIPQDRSCSPSWNPFVHSSAQV